MLTFHNGLFLSKYSHKIRAFLLIQYLTISVCVLYAKAFNFWIVVLFFSFDRHFESELNLEFLFIYSEKNIEKIKTLTFIPAKLNTVALKKNKTKNATVFFCIINIL